MIQHFLRIVKWAELTRALTPYRPEERPALAASAEGAFQDFGERETRENLEHGTHGKARKRGREPPFSALSAGSVCSALQNALPAKNLKCTL
jgi:hypothetical protein